MPVRVTWSKVNRNSAADAPAVDGDGEMQTNTATILINNCMSHQPLSARPIAACYSLVAI